MIRASRDRFGVTMLLLAAFVSPWNAIEVAGFQLVDMALALSLAASVAYTLRANVPLARLPQWWRVGVIGIASVTVVQTCINSNFSELVTGTKWLIAAALIPWLTTLHSRSDHELPARLLASWSLGIALSAAVATTDFANLTRINAGLVGFETISGRQGGLTSQPNNVGLGCAMAMPVVLYFSRSSRRWAPIALLLFVGSIVSGSRAGQVALVGITLVYMLFPPDSQNDRYKARGRFIAGAAALAVLAALSASVRSAFAPMLRFLNSDSSVAQSNLGRAELARSAFNQFVQHPAVGVGLDQLKIGHSVPLQLAASGGLLLLMTFSWYTLGGLKTGLRLGRGNGLVGAAAFSHGAWVLAGLVSNAISDRYLYLPIAAVAAAVVVRSSSSPNQGKPHQASRTSAPARLID